MEKVKNDFIKSTLDRGGKAWLKEVIPVNKLISGYDNQFGIDISQYFNGITEVKTYECESTKYCFYYPFNIDGSDVFYEHLQKFDWYYMPWKWEHETTRKLLSGNEKVLEVGSGGLGFVENLYKSGFDITGLELNKQSIVNAAAKGLKVLDETIQDHAKNHFEKYDMVCSYQVLEHITDVSTFIKAQVDCLKKGGKLIIAVPNNDSFIKLTKGGLLNFPPHHMGLWNKESLKSLVDLFDLKVDKILYEPLQEYHLDWYINSTIQHRINKNKITRVLFKKLKLEKIYLGLIKNIRSKIHGHTIMVIYTKV